MASAGALRFGLFFLVCNALVGNAVRLAMRRQSLPPETTGLQFLYLNTSLYTAYDNRFYVDIYLGQPAQKFSVAVDLNAAMSWVPGPDCLMASYIQCRFVGNSTTYLPENSRTSRTLNFYKHSDGVLGPIYTDSLGIVNGQNVLDDFEFIVGKAVPHLADDRGGRLGLGFRQMMVERPLVEVLRDKKIFDPPVFGLKLNYGPERGVLGDTGELVFGSALDQLCPHGSSVHRLRTAALDAAGLLRSADWSFYMQASFGDTKLSAQLAVIDINTEYIELPEKAYRHFELEYPNLNDAEFDCDLLPERYMLILTLVPDAYYGIFIVKDLTKKQPNGRCSWRLRRSSDDRWHLGQIFMAGRCVGFDYGAGEILLYH